MYFRNIRSTWQTQAKQPFFSSHMHWSQQDTPLSPAFSCSAVINHPSAPQIPPLFSHGLHGSRLPFYYAQLSCSRLQFTLSSMGSQLHFALNPRSFQPKLVHSLHPPGLSQPKLPPRHFSCDTSPSPASLWLPPGGGSVRLRGARCSGRRSARWELSSTAWC